MARLQQAGVESGCLDKDDLPADTPAYDLGADKAVAARARLRTERFTSGISRDS